MSTKASSAETANIGENALARFAKAPFDAFKEDAEFSPVDAIVEEILGRLGCLRRNQVVVDIISDYSSIVLQNSIKLLRDYDMRVIHITEYPKDMSEFHFSNIETEVQNGVPVDEILKKKNVPKEFPLLCIDTATVDIPYSPLVVVATADTTLNPWESGKGGFKDTTEAWAEKGYSCVAMAEKFIVLIRTNDATKAGVKNIVLRNPSMLFDWKAHGKNTGFTS
ncbi:hypothetical protein ATCVGM07011_257L [Acanthocystis turfacea Chlorella virus GM0701.1]|nr:hypothetical protein ATCVGM07011_257L [Acanthocystis turfacea Chlorella virus GM0701.1]